MTATMSIEKAPQKKAAKMSPRAHFSIENDSATDVSQTKTKKSLEAIMTQRSQRNQTIDVA